MKKLALTLTSLILLISAACAQTTFDKSKAVKDSKTVNFKSIDGITLTKNMKTGWNLGNTLDAINGSGLNTETSWGMPKTTKAMIDGLAKSGIKTIRIPVSWSNHLIDDKYTIDPAWMKRVKEVVDWAIGNDMYVILNSHHDCYERPSKMPYGKGYYPNSTNYEESKKFLTNIWAQICIAFNNGYDEHLIFETMNEPRLRGTDHEWWFDKNNAECVDGAKTLNKLNQDVLNTIRASGGNNGKRFVMIPGLQAAPGSVYASEFALPKDSIKGRLMISVHMYTPYVFAMETPGTREFGQNLKNELATEFKTLNDKFISKGIPVVIGEYGATNKGNTEARVEWFGFFIKFSRKYNMVACLWDNGQFSADKKNGEKYGFYNRNTKKWAIPEILTAILDNCDSQ